MAIRFEKNEIINIQIINPSLFPDCVQKHKEIIDKDGFCYWGRFGKNVGEKSFCCYNKHVIQLSCLV